MTSKFGLEVIFICDFHDTRGRFGAHTVPEIATF